MRNVPKLESIKKITIEFGSVRFDSIKFKSIELYYTCRVKLFGIL